MIDNLNFPSDTPSGDSEFRLAEFWFFNMRTRALLVSSGVRCTRSDAQRYAAKLASTHGVSVGFVAAGHTPGIALAPARATSFVRGFVGGLV